MHLLRPTAVLALAFLAACGSSDDPTDPMGNGDNNPPPTETRTIKANPSFRTDIEEIFTRRGCSAGSCHGAAVSNNLDLRAGAAYANLVNVVAFGDGNETRVIPNDAQGSYLVKKLEGRQTVGSTMPLGGAPLDNIDMTNIRNWIDTGADNN